MLKKKKQRHGKVLLVVFKQFKPPIITMSRFLQLIAELMKIRNQMPIYHKEMKVLLTNH